MSDQPNESENDPRIRKDSLARAREQRAEMEEALTMFQANRETYEMTQKQLAQMFFVRFTALIDAGFNEVQAMTLLTTRGLA